MKTLLERVNAIKKECNGVWAEYNITSWERTFLDNVAHKAYLTEKQERVMTQIEAKAFPPDNEYA